jgi:hypothetical protein
MMCPEERCTINTNKPYTISHSQPKVYHKIAAITKSCLCLNKIDRLNLIEIFSIIAFLN